MASFEIIGTLKVKRDTQVVSDKFSKREFVITTDLNTPYPQYINLQLTQDKCSLLDSYQMGDEIKVSFNLRGREWSGPDGTKYFNSLDAWRVERASSAQAAAPQQQYAAPTANVDVMPTQEIGDDLPF